MQEIDHNEVRALAERIPITVEAFKPMIRRKDGSQYGFTTFKFTTTEVTDVTGKVLGHVGGGVGYVTFWLAESQEEWLIGHDDLWHAMSQALRAEEE